MKRRGAQRRWRHSKCVKGEAHQRRCRRRSFEFRCTQSCRGRLLHSNRVLVRCVHAACKQWLPCVRGARACRTGRGLVAKENDHQKPTDTNNCPGHSVSAKRRTGGRTQPAQERRSARTHAPLTQVSVSVQRPSQGSTAAWKIDTGEFQPGRIQGGAALCTRRCTILSQTQLTAQKDEVSRRRETHEHRRC